MSYRKLQDETVQTYRVQMDIDSSDVFVDATDEKSVADYCFSELGAEPLSVELAHQIPANSTVYGYGQYCGYEYKTQEAR